VRAAVPTVGLAPDPAVPGRDALLDAAEMADRLSLLMGTDAALYIDRYTRGRVKYRVGGSLRVVHEIEVGGERRVIASRTFRGTRGEEVYERALETARPVGSLRGVAYDPELEAVFWTFPNDRKIETLTALMDGTDAVSALLGRPIGRTLLAAYAPEKSATAACFDELAGRPVAYAKVFADSAELAASLHAHNAVFDALGTSSSALRVPAVLGWSQEDCMLVVEAVEGRRIDTLRGPDLLEAMRRFGAALATLHSLPVPQGVDPFPRLQPARQPAAAELIGGARPDVAAAAARLADELVADVPAPAETVCLHGDVHLKNGLLQGRRIALIDLDQVGTGPAAADLGSAMAGIRFHALVGDETARGSRLQRALLDGYAAMRELPDAHALCWHVAAALLSERALRSVNRIRPEGLAHLGAVLADARAALRGEAIA
jgi:Ser/Thr protein kinase RdoA (MazF antagonist)